MPIAGSGIIIGQTYLAAHPGHGAALSEGRHRSDGADAGGERVFNAALAKWFLNITDAKTQDGMFAHVNKFEKKPYPSVDGIKQVFALYDSPEMRGTRLKNSTTPASWRGYGQERLPRQSE